MSLSQLEREVRLLKIYVAVLTVFLLAVLLDLPGLAQNQRQWFGEIDVERINIVENDGRLRMTISNKERAPDPIINGQTIQRQGGNPPGLIFFNDDGDERGVLVYDNDSASLTFDRYRQPEVMRFAHSENAQGIDGGFTVLDRPNQPLSAQDLKRMQEEEARRRALPPAEREAAMKKLIDDAVRKGEGLGGDVRLFAGRRRDRTAVVSLADAVGRPRLRLAVTAQGAASLEFLDENGTVNGAVSL